MNNVIDQSQIQESIVKIEYKENQGTGFFVSKNIILTAFHIFFETEIDNSKLILTKEKDRIICQVLSYNIELDICIIKTEGTFDSYLPIQSSNIRINEDWITFGFPYQGEQKATKFYGTIGYKETEERYDLVLKSEKVDSDYNYEGLSGAPIICNEKVIGLVLKQIDNALGVVSIDKISTYLKEQNIDFEIEESHTNIPSQFSDEIKHSVKNSTVLNSLEDAILKDGNWLLMTGNPGSGKSLNIASFNPKDQNISIIGKYFVKIPNDDKPKSLRASRNFFLKWLEELITFTIYGTPLAKESKSLEERIERLPILIRELSDYCVEKKQIGVFCIDGLDEIEELSDFLGILNFTLPENIKILLSCISKEILPSEIKNYLNSEQIVVVTPIKQIQCEYLIINEIGENKLQIENVQLLALKSEGHPLYLRYLINRIKERKELTQEQNNFKDWLDSIPLIEGDIENYYSSIWDNIYQDKNKLWISLSISQLRSPLEEKYVILTLPPDVKASFYTSFPEIKYLFKEHGGKLEIYHNSFKEFISKRLELFIKDCNDNIVSFCENNEGAEYSIENSLYHYTLSNNPEHAIQNCNQEWADVLALNHVEPDLVLLDIKNTIDLSLKLEQTTELIRLLLLLQRIEFRYDFVLYEYADNMALALIASKQYRQALKYIVRRNVLLVSNPKAVTFLQMFYEAGATEEANLLLEAIDALFRKEFESKSRSGGGIAMDLFIMKANSIVLSARENPEEGIRKFMAFSSFLRKLDDDENIDEKKSSSGMTLTREFCTAWHFAYVMRAADIHIDPIKVSEFSGNPLNNRWAKMIALSKYMYDNDLNQYNTNYYEKSNNHFKLIKDVEYLVTNHGYIHDEVELKLLIQSLINDSENITLVTNLIKEHQKFDIEEKTIRQENGVDFDYLAFKDVGFQSKCLGYINQDDLFPKIETRWGKKGWETYVNSLIVNIYFLEGKAYNLKAKNNSDKLPLIKNQLNLIKESIDFTFEERSHWDRSYQLPEMIFPILYGKLINLYCYFDIDSLDTFLEEIKDAKTNQLGLYSEGYRELLFEIVKELLLVNYDSDKIEPIVQIWEQHIIYGVQNRWERTEELLKISEIYALLDLTPKFNNTFQEVLNTSMGPTWYKEAQLDLLNSTLSYLKSDSASLNSQIKDYASLLDYASGEMTFQRYVRVEKEDFIGSLILNNRLWSALEYFKQEILPSPKLLIDNAENNKFDAPTLGNGYNLGARNFVEQSGILKILKTIKNVSPYIKWALCQIFVVNDDNFRYITNFGEQIAKTLNEIEKLDNSFIEDVCNQLSIIIKSGELNQDDTRAFLNILFTELTSTNITCLKLCLAKKDITWGSEDHGKEIIENKQLEKEGEAPEFAKFNNSVSSGMDRLKLIKSGISAFEKEKISIWYNNWSVEQGNSKRKLKELFSTDIEVLQTLSNDILKFDESPWSVTREVMWFLEKKLTKPQIESIYRTINSHFHYIIRPDIISKEKYSWLDDEGKKAGGCLQIIDFLIWLLNHPFQYIRQKTFDVLVQLVAYIGEDIVVSLINTSISNTPILSTQSSSFVLKTISEKTPEVIVNVLNKKPNLVYQIASTPHFTIKYNFITIANNVDALGYERLKIEIDKTIPNTITKTGEVFLEEASLFPIEFEISQLNDKKLLNREFCEKLISKVEEFCSPLKTMDIVKSDKYLRRSFYDEPEYQGRYVDILNHALNVAITDTVDRNSIELVYKILNDD